MPVLGSVRRATLIVNPAAGRARGLAAEMPAIRMLLEAHGYAVDCIETSAADDSARLLSAAAARRSLLVIACGGDGTVHGAVQGLAHTDAVLGVVPLGTANALARNLGVPLEPVAAVERLLTYTSRRIPLGGVATAAGTRFFAVMAGCGPDGALVQELSGVGSGRLKARFGRVAYYIHAGRLFWTRRWPGFRVEYRRADSAEWVSCAAVAVMASRIPDLGGLFSGTTRESRLEQTQLRVQLLRGPAQFAFPAWMVSGRTGLPNPWLTTVDVAELRCSPMDARPVYAQGDAEPLGTLPMRLWIEQEALSLLMPGG